MKRILGGWRSIAFAALGVVAFTATTLSAAPTIVNGDFETSVDSFVVWPGYVGGDNPANIVGWTGDGGRGINPLGGGPEVGSAPFRDNGGNTSSVAFLQGTSHIEQAVSGFIPGREYVLSLEFNARNCCGDIPIANLFLNGIPAGSSTDLFPAPGGVIPVGGTNPWYAADIEFTAPEETVTLRIETMPAAGGDSTLLVDNVSFALVPEPATGSLAAIAALLGLLPLRRRA